MYTSGALILTDDGNFVYKVTHPKHEIEKTYTVTLKGIIGKEKTKSKKKKTSKRRFRKIGTPFLSKSFYLTVISFIQLATNLPHSWHVFLKDKLPS